VPLAYRNAGLSQGKAQDPALVRALQQDLRTLGYLARGIDGNFGPGTTLAVRRLQWDLRRNNGASTRNDGPAPVAMVTFNRGVTGVTGTVDAALADSIEAALADARFTRVPQSSDPAAANQRARDAVAGIRGAAAPVPFLLAIFQQESSGEHYAEPTGKNETDTFVTIGLDHNGPTPEQVTSRGYGLGQYTIFHHPPRLEEVADFIVDPVRNVQKGFAELREKFDKFVAGPAGIANDRAAEHPALSLRLCRYGSSDPKYMRACKACAAEVGKLDITANTPLFHESAQTYGQAKYYANKNYPGVPDRAAFRCDWPYAIRRYNGDGPDSYNYQAKILSGLLSGPTIPTGASP
jgi:peptidoglycan hydrolase-like protein with peptidoglycan-binding domain